MNTIQAVARFRRADRALIAIRRRRLNGPTSERNGAATERIQHLLEETVNDALDDLDATADSPIARLLTEESTVMERLGDARRAGKVAPELAQRLQQIRVQLRDLAAAC